MAQRTVQFNMDFDVGNLNTIGELENELTAINEQLKYVDVNSDSFKKLSQQAQEVDGKLRTIETSLEGVTAQEKAESLKVLGEAGVGAFQAMAGASLLFGDKVGEEIEKATQKATAMFNVFDGLQKVTRVFSAETVKGLGAVVKGFQKSSIAAKLFGTTTRAALTATGIGALIVLIGIVIANFDKLKAAVQKNADAIKNALKFIAPPLYAIIEVVEAIKKQFGDLQNFIAGVGAAIKSILQFDFKGMKDAFREEVELQKELDQLRDDYNDKITETEKAYEREIELLKEQGASQEEINEKIRERLELERDLLQPLVDSGKATDEQIERLDEVNYQLKLQEVREKRLARERQKEAAKEKKRQDEILKKEKEKTAELEKQKVLDEIEEKRETAQLQRANLLQSITLNIQKIQAEINQLFLSEELALDTINTLSEEQIKNYEDQIDKLTKINEFTQNVLADDRLHVDLLKAIGERYGEIQTAVGNIEPPFERLEEYQEAVSAIANEYATQVDLLMEVDKLIEGYTTENENGEGIVLNITKEQRRQLFILQQQIEIFEEQRKLRLEELDTLIKEQEILINTNLQYDKKLNATLVEIEKQIDLNKQKQMGLEWDLFTAESKLEAQLIQEKLLAAEERAVELAEKESQTRAEIERNQRNIEKSTDVIVRAEEEKSEVIDEQNTALAQQGKILADNSLIYENAWEKAVANIKKFLESTMSDVTDSIRDFFEEGMGEELLKFGDAMTMMYDAIAMKQAAVAEQRRRDLDEWVKDNEDALKELADLKDDHADKEAELNEMLRDAEGDRYDDIKAQIEATQQAEEVRAEREKTLMAEKAAIQDKIAQAEWKQAKAEKAASIVQAVIQGILATVEALPNLVLAGIVGVASAASVAAMIATPLPPKPQSIAQSLGDGGMLEGPSHDDGGIPAIMEGGEYVVNKQSTSQYLPLLEALNARKFQDGGQITQATPTMPDTPTDIIDYERLAQAMARQPVFASWSEGQQVGRKMEFVEGRSSF